MKKKLEGVFLILLFYVNNILIVVHDKFKTDKLKSGISQLFAMKDLGPVKQIIGMRSLVIGRL